jgi:capsular exopolysaccharide synthesis family protein
MSIEAVLALLRRRAFWVVLATLIAGLAALGLSKLETPRYTATASLLFNSTNVADSVAGLSTASSNSPEQSIQDTNVTILKLGDVAARTAQRMGHGFTPATVRAALSIYAVSDTSVVNVAATSTSRVIARRLANTYSGIFVAEQEAQNKTYYDAALSTVNAQLAALSPAERVAAQGLALQERADSLATIADLPSGVVSIAAMATTPMSPSSPNTLRNTAVGLLLGLFLGFAGALLLERLDQRIREPVEFEGIYRLPLLGGIPRTRTLAQSAGRQAASPGWLGSDLEAFHLIRAHLRYFGVDHELRTLLVVSAGTGEGKTTIAAHLAAAAAVTGSRAVLVEADLRRPTIARYLGIESGPGLCDAIIGATPLDEVVQRVPFGATPDADHPAPSLDVITAGGTLPPNPAELLESHAFATILASLAADYDTVILDSAPLGPVSDAFSLLASVDGVLIIGRVDVARRDVAARLHHTLTAGHSNLLGVVANAVNPRVGDAYGYGYTG